MDERELLARIALGDSTAAEQVCSRWLGPVYRFIRAHSGCPPEEAEDIAQETFVAFLRSVGQFRGDASIYTWLCAIARRKLVDHYRKQGRLAKRSAGPLDDRLATLASDEPLPEDIIDDEELRRAVLTEIWQLPEAYRQVLLDKYVANRSTAEIAKINGKTPKAIESMLARARAALRTRLELQDQQHPDGRGGGLNVARPVGREPVPASRRR